jgi:hypothetical protein
MDFALRLRWCPKSFLNRRKAQGGIQRRRAFSTVRSGLSSLPDETSSGRFASRTPEGQGTISAQSPETGASPGFYFHLTDQVG